MPLPSYLIVHSEAPLSESDRRRRSSGRSGRAA
jgi:hypothetical protein